MDATQAKAIAIDYLYDLAKHFDLVSGRDFLLRRCATYLTEQCLLSRERAELIAIEAFGEMEAKGCEYTIDIDRSTSFSLVVFNSRTRKSQAYTIVEVIKHLPQA